MQDRAQEEQAMKVGRTRVAGTRKTMIDRDAPSDAPLPPNAGITRQRQEGITATSTGDTADARQRHKAHRFGRRRRRRWGRGVAGARICDGDKAMATGMTTTTTTTKNI